MAGRIVVVGTPIGNLGDLSPRAAAALGAATVVACEDTRRTGRLLSAMGIARVPMVVVNEHTEAGVAESLVARAATGEVVALVSDAGMPLVSDPGGAVVAAAVAAGVEVDVVPGPTALAAALAVAGIDAHRFVFDGFLPRKGPERRARLAALVGEARAVVLYEAPHRLARTVGDLEETLGADRPVALARELTKLHQDVWRGTLGDAVDHVAAVESRGEYVLVVAGATEVVEVGDDEIAAAVRAAMSAGTTRRGAIDEVATSLGVARRRVYRLALESPDP